LRLLSSQLSILLNVFWQSVLRSGPKDLRLGRRELFVCQHTRGVQLAEVFELISRVRRRRRIGRLLLVLGGRLLLRRLLVVSLLFLRGATGPVASDRSSGHRSD
jgi:hypothetical protein